MVDTRLITQHSKKAERESAPENKKTFHHPVQKKVIPRNSNGVNDNFVYDDEFLIRG